MKIFRLRYIIQIVSFVVLLWGGYFGLRFANFLPNWTCPLTVYEKEAGCYLMPLQRLQYGVRRDPQEELAGVFCFRDYSVIWKPWKTYLTFFGAIFLFVLLSNKSWCGWLCPFGTLQDGISGVRKRLKIRETAFSEGTKKQIRVVRNIFFALFIIPILVLFFSEVFRLPNQKLVQYARFPHARPFYCNLVCPAKTIMRPIEANIARPGRYSNNMHRFFMYKFSAFISGIVLVGIFFRRRFFCYFCPILALLNLFHRASFLRLEKKQDSCTRCGNCWRACPMDIKDIYENKKDEKIDRSDCVFCLKCVENCPENNTLSVKFLKWKFFASARKYFFNLKSRIK